MTTKPYGRGSGKLALDRGPKKMTLDQATPTPAETESTERAKEEQRRREKELKEQQQQSKKSSR
jgi:uncharacterized protein YaiL (DUF2058 family)